MKYALLIYPKPGSHEELGEDESKSVSAEYWAFREDPRCLGGAHLQPIETATTVRYGDGENLIIDGPYADAKEVLGGYFVFDASNLDDALEVAQRIPAVRLGGAVEVRPLVTWIWPRRPPRRRLRSRPSVGRATGCRSTRWPGWWPPGATAPSTARDASGRSWQRRGCCRSINPQRPWTSSISTTARSRTSAGS